MAYTLGVYLLQVRFLSAWYSINFNIGENGLAGLTQLAEYLFCKHIIGVQVL
jgi:hypothetical protein